MTRDTLTPGTPLNGRLTLIRRLHAGETREVWLVRDLRREQDLVAKILPAGWSAEDITLLRREYRHSRQLVHPNIVGACDIHEGDHFSFITMPHVDGEDIGQFRGQRPAEILRRVLPIADALQYAHDEKIVHRDVKVSNVLCDGSGRPYLIDLGVSSRLGPDGQTLVGGGSPYSVSPQQLAGEPAQPADDIYAFGVLLYELIHGHPPFWPEITPARVREELPPPMRSPYPLDPSLQDLIARMLAKSAEHRPPDMATVKAELQLQLQIQNSLADETESPRSGGGSAVRLTPPPRVSPVRPLSRRRLRQPAAGEATVHGSHRALKWVTLAVVGLLAAVAAGVFFVLPRWSHQLAWTAQPTQAHGAVARPAEEQAPTAPSSSGVPGALTVDDGSSIKQRVVELRHRVVGLVEDLTARGAALWSGDGFATAMASVTTGEEHLDQRQYAEAEAVFTAALRQLESLDAGSAAALGRALADGQRALTAADPARAAAAFDLALKIAPDNGVASSGKKRAERLPEVLALIELGQRIERDGQLEQARVSYDRAAMLDPLWQPAQEALSRVRREIAEDVFAQNMSEGLRALQNGDFTAARAALTRAQELRPGSPQVADALVQVEQAENLQAVSLYREEALSLEAAESWRSAAERYAAVLELDPTIRFAQEGHGRSLARAELSERLTFHLDHPGRLATGGVFDEASVLLAEAIKIEPAGPGHRRQVERLETLLEAARTPVRVYLESDNLTEITVYHVGRLGTFTRRALDLRPGTYTVVGSRHGYRDVRRQLVVVAGAVSEPFVVRCEEKI